MRRLLCQSSLALVTVLVPAAHADTFTLTFLSDAGDIIGSGTLSTNTTAPASATTFYEAGDAGNTGYTITGFTASFYANQFTFNLASESNPTTATLTGSVLNDLEYSQYPDPDFGFSGVASLGIYGNSFDLFNSLAPFPNVEGTFTATAPTGITPEPATLALLGSGLLGSLGLLRRRLAAQASHQNLS